MSTVTRAGLRWRWATDVLAIRDELGGFLGASVDDDGILGYREPPSPRQVREFAEDLQRGVTKGVAHLLVGSGASALAAMCVLKPSSMPNCRHIAEVSKAYLTPAVRRTGALLELAGNVCDKARELGVEKLVIDVREQSPAYRTWLRLGFTTFGTLEDYARIGGVSHRGHYMEHSPAALRAVVDSVQAAGRHG
ncbi:hypothetical protein KBX71_07025 [Micromonospora sp. D93]|uniref:GNAT family N-acetyltransferase n=1 Tax=Micromonospora sp. D93 TaxID=2824886 RepID=UPI001B387B34|nr:hypothetical protein [Micromonospora sp. D93]MBQ1017620.1 hypothetical protein [Micromonospora sp. D93]